MILKYLPLIAQEVVGWRPATFDNANRDSGTYGILSVRNLLAGKNWLCIINIWAILYGSQGQKDGTVSMASRYAVWGAVRYRTVHNDYCPSIAIVSRVPYSTVPFCLRITELIAVWGSVQYHTVYNDYCPSTGNVIYIGR